MGSEQSPGRNCYAAAAVSMLPSLSAVRLVFSPAGSTRKLKSRRLTGRALRMESLEDAASSLIWPRWVYLFGDQPWEDMQLP
jgi:hypothetical protein